MADTAIQIDFLLSGSTLDDGTANNGGKVFFWESGGAFATNKSVYEDKGKVTEYDYVIASGSEPHTNKNYVLLDAGGKPVAEAGGRAEVFGDGTYDIQIYDSSNVIVDTLLSVSYAVVPSSTRTGTTKSASPVTIDSSTNAYYFDTSGGNITATFDFDASSVDAGHNVTCLIVTGTNDVIITPKSGGTIGGKSTWTITGLNSKARLESDGATDNWGIAVGEISPSFGVYLSGNQAGTGGGTYDKIEFDTVEFNIHSNFDNITNYRFTPTIAGKFLLCLTVGVSDTADGEDFIFGIYKNGAQHKMSKMNATEATMISSMSAIVDANGTTDYFEFYIGTTDAAYTIFGDAVQTYASGVRVV